MSWSPTRPGSTALAIDNERLTSSLLASREGLRSPAPRLIERPTRSAAIARDPTTGCRRGCAAGDAGGFRRPEDRDGGGAEPRLQEAIVELRHLVDGVVRPR